MRRPAELVLLGHPVAHSLSPRFQNAALRSAGLPVTYRALDVPPWSLDDALHALVASGAAGNVTVPHKEAVAARCARLEPLAAETGAVNTFWVYDGALAGDNTDVGGFDAAVRELNPSLPRAASVALLGSGGAAAAVLSAVRRWPGARARVWSRTQGRSERLVRRYAGAASLASSVDEALESATLVVNATPIGLHDDDALPVPIASLPDGCAVIDLAYRSGETRWVREARSCGHAAQDGLTMLLEQGALAFERWFGVVPDRDAMWDAVRGIGLRSRHQ